VVIIPGLATQVPPLMHGLEAQGLGFSHRKPVKLAGHEHSAVLANLITHSPWFKHGLGEHILT